MNKEGIDIYSLSRNVTRRDDALDLRFYGDLASTVKAERKEEKKYSKEARKEWFENRRKREKQINELIKPSLIGKTAKIQTED